MIINYLKEKNLTIKLYNTYSRKKENFVPINKKSVGIYTCGLTVYDYAHIGNLRTYLFEDILRRTLEFADYKVMHVQNITDVGHLTSDSDSGEDKIEKAAKRDHKTAWEIASYYTKTFKDDLKKINILAPHVWCKATDHITEQIELIKSLEEKGYTYKTDDGIYFDTSRLKEYGKLAKINVKGLKAGIRVKIGQKKNPTDFALWKFSYLHGRSFDTNTMDHKDRRQMEWVSPWGIGFPGWHIECSAMSMKYLGIQFDIHCGGVDHISVHHTNEIAQSQAATGKIPARYWIHGAILNVEDEKMAKSKNNFYTLRDMEKKGYNPLAYRYLILMTHYRQKMNFTWESLHAAQKGLAQIYGFLYNMFLEKRDNGHKDKPGFNKYITDKLDEFKECIGDDLNTPQALAVMFEVMHDTDEMLWSGGLSKNNLKSLEDLFIEFDKIFGLKFGQYLERGKKDEITKDVKKLVTQRISLRINGKYKEADEIRDKIEKLGYKVEDTPNGPAIKKINIRLE